MWRVWVCVGSIVWLATIGASGAINYFSGNAYGRNPTEAQIFSVLGITADAWKAIGPIFILSLWRQRHVLASVLSAAVWIVCFTFAVTSALGLAAQNRNAVVGGRESTKLSYQSGLAELNDLEVRRGRIAEQRSPDELEKLIDAVFARPIAGRGTVDTLSERCTKDVPRTRELCGEIASLRQALAQALERHRIESRIEDVRRQVNTFRDQGGALEADPQAQLISRLSFGRLAVGDVGLALVLLLVAMIELISAFAPVILHDYASAMRSKLDRDGRAESRQDREGQDRSIALEPMPDVIEYLADNVVPDPYGQVALHALLLDFSEWCEARSFRVPSLGSFVEQLNAVCDGELKGKIRRDGVMYFGFRLETSRMMLAAPVSS